MTYSYFFNICSNKDSDILKSTAFSLLISSDKEEILPSSLPFIRTPNVPIIFNPNSLAIFLPLRSSISNRDSTFSNPKAMALASPYQVAVLNSTV